MNTTYPKKPSLKVEKYFINLFISRKKIKERSRNSERYKLYKKK